AGARPQLHAQRRRPVRVLPQQRRRDHTALSGPRSRPRHRGGGRPRDPFHAGGAARPAWRREGRRMSTRRRRWIVAGVASALAIVFWMRHHDGGVDTSKAATAPHGVPVTAVPARTGDLPVHLDGIGTVTPRATVTVRTRVDGELVAVHFQEGQTVA